MAHRSLLSPRAPRHLVLAAALALSGLGFAQLPATAAASDVSVVTPDPCNGGSSNPTFYPNNRRLIVTPGGREIGVFDPHGSGQTLIWRDGSGSWNQKSIYSNQADDVNNDRPASIALDGTGNAWVVLSGYQFAKISAVKVRRLTNLDAASGPDVGPIVTVEPAGRGNIFADLAFQAGRGFIVWLERTGDTTYELVTTQFTPNSATPTFTDRAVLYSSSSASTSGTLVPMAGGMRVVARAGKLKVFVNNGGSSWSTGSASVSMPTKSKPSAIPFGSDILAAFQGPPFNDQITKVVRFSASGNTVSTSLTVGGSGTADPGYIQPSIAGNGATAFVVMVNTAGDRTVMSRQYNGTSWGSDVVEIPSSVTNGGDFAYPNTERELIGGKLRFLVDGKRCPSSTQKNAVLAYRRTV
jgi:hypothetical protein